MNLYQSLCQSQSDTTSAELSVLHAIGLMGLRKQGLFFIWIDGVTRIMDINPNMIISSSSYVNNNRTSIG